MPKKTRKRPAPPSQRRYQRKEVVAQETINGHTINFYDIELKDKSVVRVPQFIRRIHNPQKNTLGWQISIKRKGLTPYTKFFPDKEELPSVSIKRAYKALRSYLKAIPSQTQTNLRVRSEYKEKIVKTGVPGVRIFWRLNHNRGRFAYELTAEVRAGSYQPHKAQKFYVGTENTVTMHRVNQCLSRATGMRRRFLENEIAIKNHKPIKGTALRFVGVTCEQLQASLDQKKKNDRDRIYRRIVELIGDLSEKPSIISFRGIRITWSEDSIYGETVFSPDFISFHDGHWVGQLTDFTGDEVKVVRSDQNNPRTSLCETVYETLLQSVMQSPNYCKRESLFG